MSNHLNIDEVTKTFSQKVANAPALTGTLKVVIENVGTVYLETVDNSNMASNKDEDADCGVHMSEDTFKQILSGELSGMAAFMQGKLDVKGDMSIAMHLGNFL